MAQAPTRILQWDGPPARPTGLHVMVEGQEFSYGINTCPGGRANSQPCTNHRDREIWTHTTLSRLSPLADQINNVIGDLPVLLWMVTKDNKQKQMRKYCCNAHKKRHPLNVGGDDQVQGQIEQDQGLQDPEQEQLAHPPLIQEQAQQLQVQEQFAQAPEQQQVLLNQVPHADQAISVPQSEPGTLNQNPHPNVVQEIPQPQLHEDQTGPQCPNSPQNRLQELPQSELHVLLQPVTYQHVPQARHHQLQSQGLAQPSQLQPYRQPATSLTQIQGSEQGQGASFGPSLYQGHTQQQQADLLLYFSETQKTSQSSSHQPFPMQLGNFGNPYFNHSIQEQESLQLRQEVTQLKTMLNQALTRIAMLEENRSSALGSPLFGSTLNQGGFFPSLDNLLNTPTQAPSNLPPLGPSVAEAVNVNQHASSGSLFGYGNNTFDKDFWLTKSHGSHQSSSIHASTTISAEQAPKSTQSNAISPAPIPEVQPSSNTITTLQPTSINAETIRRSSTSVASTVHSTPGSVIVAQYTSESSGTNDSHGEPSGSESASPQITTQSQLKRRGHDVITPSPPSRKKSSEPDFSSGLHREDSGSSAHEVIVPPSKKKQLFTPNPLSSSRGELVSPSSAAPLHTTMSVAKDTPTRSSLHGHILEPKERERIKQQAKLVLARKN
ncbi:hypothetical protein BCR33DRAFT_742697 [Rhizoclosmatium globosum]|uniref:Uncharacterized protein n=1 Tax=Rhizoclosmatium globosum TaxID=329046 RepID=A0A1Y2BPT3_9FUNG|nr:hypothetical protein BCR33DRAFT_742697 [Rhizoclosmatium globosum]|eukprot:ORY36759.1 hypothetical protein BCR33DRAFT_742697 [Rhizoclosmatium globosum]